MPRLYTRKRGKAGKSLYNALTLKSQNGLPNNIPKNKLEYIGSGSYGSIYAYETSNIVFKKHDINVYDNRKLDKKCIEWEQEFQMQKKAYDLCNEEMNAYDVCIARPYTFRYVKQTSSGLHVTNANVASGCIYTMDHIIDGDKWDIYLTSPHKKLRIPPYIFMGTLETIANRITLERVKDAHIEYMPNESQSFCKDPGLFGMYIQRAMIESFFILIHNSIIPRDIEFVMDGRKHTQTLMAIIDFNEAKTLQERANSYGEGYDTIIDIAHVYIDLCGLRSGNTKNPMAPYDSPTPQWKFLCNPMICPSAFLECMKGHREVAEKILEYTYLYKMKSTLLHNILWEWKPLYVYRTTDESILASSDKILGVFTEKEYQIYRGRQCIFHKAELYATNDTQKYIYAQTTNSNNSYIYDIFVEFDIQFQLYILTNLLKRHTGLSTIHSSDTFYDILNKYKKVEIPQVEEWDGIGLF